MKKYLFLILALTLTAASCGGGMYTKTEPKLDDSYTVPWGNVTITKDAFILGSDFPPDIEIPDIDGMRDTAFVASFSNPSGVIAIDLNSNPLSVSGKFKGLISPDGSGFPRELFIKAADRAFLLTSDGIIDFDPTTGAIHTVKTLLSETTLDKPYPISGEFDIDGDGTNEDSIQTFKMAYPGSLAADENYLYVTMSDFINPILPAITAPGFLRVFQMLDISPYLAEVTDPIKTTDFNPTGVTILSGGLVAVTNSGVSDIWDGSAHPITNSSIDIFDPATLAISDNISLGSVALSYKQLSVTSDGARAFIGSASFGEVYEIDLQNRTVVSTHSNPITVTGNGEGSDYLSATALTYDNWYLFAASFDHSSVYPIDVTINPPDVLPAAFPSPFVLGFSKGVTPENPTGGNTGIGDISVRPGTPGIDFTGPDMFAITGVPGTIVTINTHGNKETNILQIKNMEIVPNAVTLNADQNSLQLSLKIQLGDGTIIDNVTDSFTNPYSGYPTKIGWSSNDFTVAAADQSGLVTTYKEGNAVITASIGQTEASATVTVTDPGINTESVPMEQDEEGNGQNVPMEQDEEGNDQNGNPDQQPNPYHQMRMLDPDVLKHSYHHIYKFKKELTCLDPGPDSDPFVDALVSFNPGAGAGFGQSKMPSVVFGPPEGKGPSMGGLDVVSLGFKGEIIVEMTDFIIVDCEGPDFTVFENAFYISGNENSPFSEPGIVSVSEDGESFYEFDCSCNIADKPLYPGCAGTKPTFSNSENGIDPTDPAVSGGNPFDLKDVGLKKARFVKITDCGLSGQSGNTAGFDLDAVAVINGTPQ